MLLSTLMVVAWRRSSSPERSRFCWSSSFVPFVASRTCLPLTLLQMVVITSRLLSDAHRYILRCLSTHQRILHCLVFTSISEGKDQLNFTCKELTNCIQTFSSPYSTPSS